MALGYLMPNTSSCLPRVPPAVAEVMDAAPTLYFPASVWCGRCTGVCWPCREKPRPESVQKSAGVGEEARLASVMLMLRS